MTDISDQLNELATTAPPGLAEKVLVATGAGRFYDTVAGPTGDLVVGWSRRGVYGLAPADELDDFVARHPRAAPPVHAELPPQLRSRLERAFASGKLGSLRVDLSELTDFQQAVLRKATEIPPGQLRPYGWIAREIGKPGATRAVGTALNKNPVPVLIPCHRVGRSDGSVGRYAYGEEMKRDLLRHEGLDPDSVDEAAQRGVRYIGSATTNIFCHPTCHHARRIQEENRVELSSAASAAAAGFRACRACRPPVAA